MGKKKATPTLSFPKALELSLNKGIDIKGRSRRSEYWWTILVIMIAQLIVKPVIGFYFSILFRILLETPVTIRRLHDTGRSGWWWGAYLIVITGCITYALCMLLPYRANLSLSGVINIFDNQANYKYTGWMAVEYLYNFLIFIFCCLDSEPSANKYGASPKYEEVETE